MVLMEMKGRIERYFEECGGKIAMDKESGTPVAAKRGGYVYEILPKTPTLTGLALALGMLSKAELFEGLKSGSRIKRELLKRAVSKVEENAERRLIESGTGGVKFFLVSNFNGWNSKEDSSELTAERLSRLSTGEIEGKLKGEK